MRSSSQEIPRDQNKPSVSQSALQKTFCPQKSDYSQQRAETMAEREVFAGASRNEIRFEAGPGSMEKIVFIEESIFTSCQRLTHAFSQKGKNIRVDQLTANN